MPSPPTTPRITVEHFLDAHGERLALSVSGKSVGLDRVIGEPTLNRPGLFFAGFHECFPPRRLQALGNAERAFLASQPPRRRLRNFREMCARPIPAIICSEDSLLPPDLQRAADTAGVPVLRTRLVTKRFINEATLALESEFAPAASEHGCMVDILGIGVLLRGASGIGKSECVLGLIERGYSLVSDDIVKFQSIEGKTLLGSCPSPISLHHMEVRGLGIIDIAAIFGVRSVRMQTRLDLVVTLEEWEKLQEPDRIGLDLAFYQILGIKVPHVVIPVRTGRDIGRLVEVAALDQKLRSMGRHSAKEFNERLIAHMQQKNPA